MENSLNTWNLSSFSIFSLVLVYRSFFLSLVFRFQFRLFVQNSPQYFLGVVKLCEYQSDSFFRTFSFGYQISMYVVFTDSFCYFSFHFSLCLCPIILVVWLWFVLCFVGPVTKLRSVWTKFDYRNINNDDYIMMVLVLLWKHAGNLSKV